MLEPSDGSSLPLGFPFPVEDSPAGFVWRTQQPLITSNVAAEDRWHGHMEVVQSYGIRSKCDLPLTTARRRLGSLVFACKQPAAFDAADLGFLQQVANQVAVAVDNALAFQEIQALKDQLAQEKAYLEEEIRTDHFKEMVAVSAALREVLKKVEIVAPTDSTVLIRGETGTGKELVARSLHDLSRAANALWSSSTAPPSRRACWKVNCSATRRAPSPAPSARRSAASSWRTKGRYSSTRSGKFRWSCSPSCCASCRSRSLSAWAERKRSRWTCASSQPRIATSPVW